MPGSPRVVIGGMGMLVAAALLGAGTTSAAPRADRPSLSPITATFDEALSTTFYDVELSNPGALTQWSYEFEPPADDPTCNDFRAIEVTTTRFRAAWQHADSNGCNNQGSGHAGRITVYVSTGSPPNPYKCSATITGTTTQVGPEPDPCFRPTPAPPPPTATSPPIIRKLEKKGWEDDAKVMFAGSSAFAALAFGCAVIPSPDPVSKGIAAVGLVVSVAYFAYGQYLLAKADDPPDKNYKRLAKVANARLARIEAASGVTAAEAAATNALLANASRLAGLDSALMTSFERAQGAYAARNGTWDRKQSRAAAKFARAEAKLLDARPALEAALRRAVEQAGAIALAPGDVKRGLAKVAASGFPKAVVSTARRLGASPASLSAFRARILRLKPGAVAGEVTPKIATPAIAAADRSGAKRLRALAARLDKR